MWGLWAWMTRHDGGQMLCLGAVEDSKDAAQLSHPARLCCQVLRVGSISARLMPAGVPSNTILAPPHPLGGFHAGGECSSAT
jgi:hypothetical protein